MTVNPSTYGFLKKPKYYGVHAKGEVWAVILFEGIYIPLYLSLLESCD
jgi:hypothetical protein